MDELPPSLAWSTRWLWRGDRRSRLGVACRLPDCSKVVLRSVGPGRPQEFCGPTHRKRFERQRTSLHDLVEHLESCIEVAPTMNARRLVEADLAWARRVLRSYT